jgi:hypothetical protein
VRSRLSLAAVSQRVEGAYSDVGVERRYNSIDTLASAT